MERIDKIVDYASLLFADRFEESCRHIQVDLEQHGTQFADETAAVFEELFESVVCLQSEEKKDAVEFLSISILASSILTGSYQAKLDIYDSRFLLDEYPVSAHWDLSRIYCWLEKDMKFFQNELKKQFPRLRAYELEKVRYRYTTYYDSLVQQLCSDIIEDIMNLPGFQTMQKEPKFSVTAGGYLDEGQLIWPQEVDE